jgi:hypothetical protein
MNFEEKLPRGYHWQGFLGGSFNRSLNLAQIIASRYSTLYLTKIIKIKLPRKQGIVYGVALKIKK